MVALIIPPRAAKQFASTPHSVARRLSERLEHIAKNPWAPQAGVTPLVGQHGTFRVRHGDWRAVYTLEGDHVIVERVGHRKGIYR